MTEPLIIDKSTRRHPFFALIAVVPAALGVYWVYGSVTDAWNYGVIGVLTAGPLGLLALWIAYKLVRIALARPVAKSLVIDAEGIRWAIDERIAWSMRWAEIAGVHLVRKQRDYARPSGRMETYRFIVRLTSDDFRKRHTTLKGEWRGGQRLSYRAETELIEEEAQRVREAVERLGRKEVAAEDVPLPTPAAPSVRAVVAPETGEVRKVEPARVADKGVEIDLDSVDPRRAAKVGAVFLVIAVAGFLLTRVASGGLVKAFAVVAGLSMMCAIASAGWYFGWNRERRYLSKVTIDRNRLRWYGTWKPQWWYSDQVEFGVLWNELKELRLVTVRSANGKWTKRVLELVPRETRFAERHPEMAFVHKAKLKVGGELIPLANGVYRVPDGVSAAAAERLREAVDGLRPGLLRVEERVVGASR